MAFQVSYKCKVENFIGSNVVETTKARISCEACKRKMRVNVTSNKLDDPEHDLLMTKEIGVEK